MTTTLSHQKQAEALAIELAVAQLSTLADLPARCALLGLPDPAVTHGQVLITVLGRPLALQPPAFTARYAGTEREPKPAERLLALHYLACEIPVTPEERWLTFRDFPGGAFYWQPFCARSVQPLIQAIGNDLARLQERLTRFAATIITDGPADALTARVTALGRIELQLVYRSGDEEFPPSADVLFNACARRVCCAEDAAALASRLCLGLL
jgi:hypothetical protein